MRTIFKYPLVGEKIESDGRFRVVVNMPSDPKPIRVAVQERSLGDGTELRPVPTLWAEVSPGNELRDYRFWLIGTGREAPEGCVYIGTIEIGPLVWHVYGPEAID